MTAWRDSASFRDPAGFVFEKDGAVYRQINASYADDYEKLMSGGLYDALTHDGLLIPHETCDVPALTHDAYRVIRPERIAFVSYPYEWCFGQLQDAALVTLRAMRRALDFGMTLKDASAYNVQFHHGRPLMIDTLSFASYREGQPWVAYGQFCRHFFAPLLLMAHVDLRLNELLRNHIDGVPLDLAAKLLKRKGGLSAAQHVGLHARATKRYGQAGRSGAPATPHMKHTHLVALIDSLIRAVSALKLRGVITEWGDYYGHTNYSQRASDDKAAHLRAFLDRIQPARVWDFGANDGSYTRLALRNTDDFAVAFDIDPIAVERNYATVKESGENLLPLQLDLTNPSPSIGFANRERRDIAGRSSPDCILMLAILHHLAISNNLPLDMLAAWIARLTPRAIVEFVPKEDSQVRTLLATRDDIFPLYTQDGFEAAFSPHFTTLDRRAVADSARTLYLLERKEAP